MSEEKETVGKFATLILVDGSYYKGNIIISKPERGLLVGQVELKADFHNVNPKTGEKVSIQKLSTGQKICIPVDKVKTMF